MKQKADIADFLSHRTIAIAGASRDRKKFGNAAFRALKDKGYRVYPVNPHAQEIEGERCYPNLHALPKDTEAVLCVVPPAQTEHVVREAAESGIQRIWMQRGSQSDEAVNFCREHNMQVVSGECILMYAEPAEFPHRAHRWLHNLFGG